MSRSGDKKKEREGSSSVAIRVDDLVKRYGDKLAVNRLSFEVKPGEIYGLLGAQAVPEKRQHSRSLTGF